MCCPRVALRRRRAPGTVAIVSASGSIVVELVPRERRRHLRARAGPHRPRAEHRLVRRVLVEVDEDPLAALFLPPRVGDQVGAAPRELARDRDRAARAPGSGPTRGSSRTYTWMPRLPVVFGQPSMPELVEQRAHLVRGARAPRRSRRRAAGRGRCAARRRARGRRRGSATRGSRGSRGSPPTRCARGRRRRALATSCRSAC